MSDLDPGHGDGVAALAAEHALGVLEGEDKTRAQELLLAEPAFARAVEAWQHHLADLLRPVPPEAPPAGLWPRILSRLGDGVSVVELKLRRSLAVWRGATAAAASVAAVMVGVVVWPKPPPPAPAAPPPLEAARLASSAQGQAVFIAMYDPVRRAIILTPAAVTGRSDRSPELWLIPTGGQPISLGVGAFDGTVRLAPTSSEEGGLNAGVLAVSIEPKGGSPTGKPTGPVVATGQLAKL
jgi:anti-sigma-K factor RskA